MSSTGTRYEVEHLHQPGDWLAPGYLEIDERGDVASVSDHRPDVWDAATVERISGYVVPGMLNVHSHAHQRGLAGRAEVGTSGTVEENFWTWRERMYSFANLLSPDDFEAIAAQAYVEMLKGGYTTVGEFHYLHQQPNGEPYANLAEMSERVLSAADRVGIAMTLLPVLYTQGGIGKPPGAEQRRFILTDEQFTSLVDTVAGWCATRPLLRLGIAPHSLRATTADNLNVTVRDLAGRYPDAPIHMHVSEQTREVEEVLAGLGARPGEWVMGHVPVDHRWTFIHATHFTDAERAEMIRRGVVAGLCPTTEGNLGDGIFPLTDYSGLDGLWGIGTDSDSRLSVAEELRVLAYGQRLRNQTFSVLAPREDSTGQPGRDLYDAALRGGTRSLRQPVGAIAPGLRADLVVLDADDPALVGLDNRTLLDAWVFAGTSSAVRDVFLGGKRIVHDRHHADEEGIFSRFRQTMRSLQSRT
jgi:formimidoylglutamate deiminase